MMLSFWLDVFCCCFVPELLPADSACGNSLKWLQSAFQCSNVSAAFFTICVSRTGCNSHISEVVQTASSTHGWPPLAASKNGFFSRQQEVSITAVDAYVQENTQLLFHLTALGAAGDK
jgi:hypothetical protein